MDEACQENNARDAASLRLLGGFFCVLGLLLLVAVRWSLDDGRATVVCIASSVVLLAVGVGMWLGARRLKRRAAVSQESPSRHHSPQKELR